MRTSTIAALLAGGVLLQACANQPSRELSAQDQIIRSIVRNDLRGESCPGARYCTGRGTAQVCRCVDSDAVRQMLDDGRY